MAVTLRTPTSATQPAGTTVAPAKVSGLADGDVVILRVGWGPTGTTITAVPSGFSQLGNDIVFSDNNWTQRLYIKVITDAAGEPSTWSFTFSGSTYADADAVAFVGADTTTPVASGEVTDNTGTGTTSTGTGFTAGRAGRLMHYAVSGTGARDSGPSGMANTLTYDTNIYVDDVAISAGATGDKTSAYPTSQLWAVHLVNVQEDAAGAQTVSPSSVASAEAFGDSTVVVGGALPQMLAKTGSFNTGTGTTSIPVSGLGFVPKAIFFWWSGRTGTTDTNGRATHQRGFGFATDTSNRRAVGSLAQDTPTAMVTNAITRADACIATTTTGDAVDGLGDIESIDSDGFTVAIDDAFAASIRVHWLAIGGPAIEALSIGTFSEPAATGNQDITTPGFQPNAVFFLGSMISTDAPAIAVDSSLMFGVAAGRSAIDNAVWAGGSNDGSGNAQSVTYCRLGDCIALLAAAVTSTDGRASVSSWLSNGFRLNWSERTTTTRDMHYLAIKGGEFKVGSVTTLTNTTNDIVASGLGLIPKAGLVLSHGKTESSSDTIQDDDAWSMGGFAGTSDQRAHATMDDDAAGTAVVGTAVEHDNVYIHMSNAGALDGAMNVTAMNGDSFTMRMTDADPSGAFAWYVAMGDHVLTASGIASAEAFGDPTLTAGGQTVTADAVASAEAFGTAQVDQHIAGTGIASAEAFGTTSVSQVTTVSPSSIASAEAFGTARLDLSIVQWGSTASAISANDRHLVNAFGEPRFMAGDAGWSIFIQLDLTDAGVYFADRKSRGINYILGNLIEIGFGTDPPTNINGDDPFTGTLGGGSPDFTTPKKAYWDHVLAIVRLAATYDITILAFPCYLGFGGGAEGWEAALIDNGSARAITYARYVAQLLRNEPNIIWVMGGDRTPPTSPDDVLALVNDMAGEIKAQDTRHLMTGHWAPESDTSDVAGFTDEDLTAVYPWDEPTSQFMRDAYNLSGPLPAFDIETPYEDGIASPTLASMRATEWNALLEGAAGKFFGYGGEGAGSVWVFGTGWEDNLDSTGTLHFQRMIEFIQGRRWYDLVPDASNDLVTAGRGTLGTSTYVTAAITADGQFAVCYIPGGGQITVDMSEFAGPVRARWYDPTNGAYSTVSGSPFANSGSQNFDPATNAAGDTDFVLLLEAGGHAVSHATILSPSGVASAEAFGTATVAGPVTASGIASAEAFGTAQVDQHLASTGIASAEAFGMASVNLDLAAAAIASAEAFGTTAIDLHLAPSSVASAEAFGESTTVTPGAVTVSPTGIDTADAFGDATVTVGPVTLAPDAIASAEAFGDATLTPGEVTVSPSSVASAEAFGDHVVNAGGTTIVADGVGSAEAFGTAAVVPGDVTVSPDGTASAESFGTPALTTTATVSPDGTASAEAFGDPTLTLSVAPAGVGSAEAFGTPSVESLDTTLSPTSIASGEAFGGTTVILVLQIIEPAGIPSAETFGVALVGGPPTPRMTPGSGGVEAVLSPSRTRGIIG